MITAGKKVNMSIDKSFSNTENAKCFLSPPKILEDNKLCGQLKIGN